MKWNRVLVVVLIVMLSQAVLAAVPRTINYQGLLKTDSGMIVPDNWYELTFRLYDAVSDGNLKWTERDTVSVQEGVFHVILGKNTPLDLPFDATYWLSTEINGGGELTPRVELAAAPYALRARIADTADDGDWDITGNDMQAGVTGRVSIGAGPDAEAKLYVYQDASHYAKLADNTEPSRFGVDARGADMGVRGTGSMGVYGYSAWGYGEDYDDALGVKGVGSRWGVVGQSAASWPDSTGAGIVGVGTTTPNFSYAGLFVGDVYVRAGSVGIGNDNPTYDLDVSGNIRAEGSGSGAMAHVKNNGSGNGVYGRAMANEASGGLFEALGTGSIGVEGRAAAGMGVYGEATGNNGIGVSGWATGATGTGVEAWGNTYNFYAAGPGANYVPFTGSHEVQLAEDFPRDVRPGMIVSVTGETVGRRDAEGQFTVSSTLPTVKLSDTPADKTVLGVLVAEAPLPANHWNQAQASERFATVNALGEGRAWVCDINGEIEAGDYITTSPIAGYGQKQDDDLLRSSTLGKAIESVDWKLVVETVHFEGREVRVYLIAVVYVSG